MAYPQADFITMCNSWGAGWHRGETQPLVTLAPSAALTGTVTFFLPNTASWMTDGGAQGPPHVVADQNSMQAVQGFSSDSGKGTLVDAFLRVAENFDLEFNTSNINFHEYGMAGTTAGIYDYGGGAYTASTGAWDVGKPTHQEPPGTAGTGRDYGVPTGFGPTVPSQGGWARGFRTSAWLQKQLWLNDGTHPPTEPMMAYKDYTLCDMLQFPPTGRGVVFLDASGNDILDVAKRRRFIDPYTGQLDPEPSPVPGKGMFEFMWDECYNPVLNTGYIRRISDTIYMLNPLLEIVWVSYMNFAVDDPRVSVTKIRLPTGSGEHSNLADPALVDGPTGWHPYTDEGPNALCAAYTTPYMEPNTMSTPVWPGGPTGITSPMTWGPATVGFHQFYYLWNVFIGQKNHGSGTQFLRDWISHWFADIYARQRVRGGCTYSGCPNWYYNNQFWGIWNIYNTGYHWNTLAGHMRSVYQDQGHIQNWLLLGNTTPLNYAEYQTVLAKDITSANLARLFRDFHRPRLEAAESYYRGLGKRFISIDVYDDAELTEDPWVQTGTSQDYATNGISVLPIDDWIDLHLSESGNRKWCDRIAPYFLYFSQVFGDFPVAQDDFISTPTDVPVTFDPTMNDAWGAGGPNMTPVNVEIEIAPGVWGQTLIVPSVGTWQVTNVAPGHLVTFTPVTGYTGASLIRYQISNTLGKVSIATIHMSVGLPPECPAISVFTGRVGEVFGEALAALYGVVYTVGTGSLPPGICLDPTGLMVGCPTTAGAYNFTAHITNGGSQFVDCPITVTITTAVTPTPNRDTGRGNSGSDGWALATRPTGQLIVVGPKGTATVLANP